MVSSMSEQRVVSRSKPRVTVSFEVIKNLLGSLFYECVSCGDMVEDNTITVHAVEKHGATHMSILNAPINNKNA